MTINFNNIICSGLETKATREGFEKNYGKGEKLDHSDLDAIFSLKIQLLLWPLERAHSFNIIFSSVSLPEQTPRWDVFQVFFKREITQNDVTVTYYNTTFIWKTPINMCNIWHASFWQNCINMMWLCLCIWQTLLPKETYKWGYNITANIKANIKAT